MASYLAEQIARDKARYQASKRESARRNRKVTLVSCSRCGADTEYVAGLSQQTCSQCWFRP